ncbi:Gypsy retrotransposon integrase-like protein 1, partial [Mucuna pruriens]
MSLLIEYLKDEQLPSHLTEAKKLVRDVAKYIIVGEQLYRRGFSFPLLRCLEGEESQYVVKEVHEGVCGTHIGGRTLASKIASAGYYWSTLKNDCMEYVKKCDRCQRFVEVTTTLFEKLHSVISPWPFYKWGVDILGPFPPAPGQVKYLIVAIDNSLQKNSILATAKISG